MADGTKKPKVALDQIQSNVLRGFHFGDALGYAEYLFLSLGCRDEARRWLSALKAHITSCTRWDEWQTGKEDPVVINVGFTYAGMLRFADPPRDTSEGKWFANHQAFREGAVKRSERTPALGDVRESHPCCWDEHFRRHDLDALVSVSATTPEALADAVELVRRITTACITTPASGVVGVESGARLEHGAEHFGFVDGIGQPDIEGVGLPRVSGGGTPTRFGWKSVPVGEFVLGYADALRAAPEAGELLENGTFLVFRKLSQDVARFRDYLCELAKRTKVSEELLAARFVGRWRSGAPLMVAPEEDDADLAKSRERNNYFRYSGDKLGRRCPLGAHIRRANPRDESKGPTPLQTQTHRVIRRSIPYGPPFDVEPSKPRGLLFVAVNANIENQFEFVQSSWINSTLSSASLTLSADKDPVLGANDGTGKFMMPGKDGPVFAWDLPRFVFVQGGAYFFLPSLTALESLAAGKVKDLSPFFGPLETTRDKPFR